MLQVKYKQSAGELLLVLLVTTIYLGSIVGAVLPHVDREMDQVHSQYRPLIGPLSQYWALIGQLTQY